MNDAPVVTATPASGGVTENAVLSAVVASLSISDVDSDPDASSIVLLDDAGGRFALSGRDIVVANSVLLDYEQASSHTVTVQVTDAQGGVTVQNVTIDLTDQSPENVTGTAAADVIMSAAGNDTLNGRIGQ